MSGTPPQDPVGAQHLPRGRLLDLLQTDLRQKEQAEEHQQQVAYQHRDAQRAKAEKIDDWARRRVAQRAADGRAVK